ncbi:MAG: type IX secretion system membrane protein PorP/SprF, partial [Bacteroidota bacterium]
MQRRWFRVLGCLMVYMFCANVQAQDPLLSQYFINKAYLNPALTAFEGGMGLGMQYRRQQYQVGGSNVVFTTNGSFKSGQSRIEIGLIDKILGKQRIL